MCRVTSVGNRESHIFVISEEVSLPKMSPKTLSTQSKKGALSPYVPDRGYMRIYSWRRRMMD